MKKRDLREFISANMITVNLMMSDSDLCLLILDDKISNYSFHMSLERKYFDTYKAYDASRV